MSSSDVYDRIYEAEAVNDHAELQRIFRFITTEDLNAPTEHSPSTTLLMMLITQFDRNNQNSNFLLNLLDSPNVDGTRLNINQRNLISQQTPLMYAANRGHVEIAAKLLSWGADVELMTMQNATALEHACQAGWVEMFKLLAPLVSNQQFDIRTIYNNLTIRDIVVANLSRAPPRYREVLRLIDEERARRGMVDVRIAMS